MSTSTAASSRPRAVAPSRSSGCVGPSASFRGATPKCCSARSRHSSRSGARVRSPRSASRISPAPVTCGCGCRSFAPRWNRDTPCAWPSRWPCWPPRPAPPRGSSTPSPTRPSGAVAPICRRGCASRGARPTIPARSLSAATWAGSLRATRCSSRAPSPRTRASKSARSSSWRRRSAGRRSRDWAGAGSVRTSGRPARRSAPKAAGVSSTSGPGAK